MFRQPRILFKVNTQKKKSYPRLEFCLFTTFLQQLSMIVISFHCVYIEFWWFIAPTQTHFLFISNSPIPWCDLFKMISCYIDRHSSAYVNLRLVNLDTHDNLWWVSLFRLFSFFSLVAPTMLFATFVFIYLKIDEYRHIQHIYNTQAHITIDYQYILLKTWE